MIIFAKEDGRVESSPSFMPKGSGGVPVQVFAPYFAGCTCEVWVNPPSALQLDPAILTPEFGGRSGVWAGELPPGAADGAGRGEYQLRFTDAQGRRTATLSGTYGVQRGVVDAYPDNMDDLSGYSLASLATLLSQFANRLEDIYEQMVTEDNLTEKMEEIPYTMKLTENLLSWGFSGKVLASVLLTGLVGMTGCVFSEKENRESLATILESVPIIADSESEAAEINTVRETLVETLRAEEPEVLDSLTVNLTQFKYDTQTGKYVVYTGAGSKFKTYADIDASARIATQAIYTKGDEISRTEFVSGTVVNGSSAISENEPLYVSYDGKIGEVHFTIADADTVKSSTLYWFGRAITGNSDTGSAVEIARGTTFESLVESNCIYYVVDYENNGIIQSSASDYAEGTLFVGVDNGDDSFDKVLTVSGGTGRKYTVFYGSTNMEVVGKEVTVDVVDDVIPIGIALSQSSAELKVGDTLQLTATVLPENAADMTVYWQSTSPEYVAVLDGRVSVNDYPPNGSVIISAYPAGYPSLVAMCTISVEEYVPVASVTISQTSATLKVGETLQLTATVLPENATFKEVAWQANLPEYATVKDGLVTIKAYPPDGEIWVYAVSGTVVSKECYITVEEEYVPITGITLSQTSASGLNPAETLQLTATVLPENATNKQVTWISSSGIATVEDGLVTVVGLGSATITAQSNDDATIKASCEITTVEGFAVYPKSYSMKVGETAEIPYFIYPEAENANITIETEEGIELVSLDTTNRKIVIKATQEGEFTCTAMRNDDDDKGIQYFLVTVEASDGGYVDEDGLLHLTPDDGVTTSEIGLQNANVLQEALNQGGTVTLYPGEYPLEPLIVTVGWNAEKGEAIDNVTLNLNGSVLKSTKRKYSGGGLIMLRGNNPTLRGGDTVPVVTENENPAEGENNLIVTGGGLCGMFDTPDDMSDGKRDFKIDIEGNQASDTGKEYKYWENEALVAPVPYGYTNATIENLDLHNCWGYAICERGTSPSAIIGAVVNDEDMVSSTSSSNIGGEITQVDGGYQFVSDDFWFNSIHVNLQTNLKPPYTRMCVHNGFAYFRYVSDKPVEYTFKDYTGATIEAISEAPGIPILIPEGASLVSIKVFWATGNDSWHHYLNQSGEVVYNKVGLRLLGDYEGGLTVRGCKTHHNASLGMVGAATGKTVAENCESWKQGMPYDIATEADMADRAQTTVVGTVGNTVGFIDIEDVPSPSVELNNCHSHDDVHFALLGAYKAKVTNCTGKEVLIYGGWNAEIDSSDCDAGASTESVRTPVSITNCSKIGTSSTTDFPANVVGTGCTIYNKAVDALPGFATGNNTFIYDKSNAPMGSISGVVKMTIRQTNSAACFFGCSVFAPAEGSTVKLEINATPEGLFAFCPGIKGADTGTYYVDECDDSFYPNGNTVYGATITPGSVFHNDDVANVAGTFDNCTIDTSNRSLFYPTGHAYGVIVVFKNCTIHNSENCIFGVYDDGTTYGRYGWGGKEDNTTTPQCVFTFEDCDFDNDNYQSMIYATTSENGAVRTPGAPKLVFTNCTVNGVAQTANTSE